MADLVAHAIIEKDDGLERHAWWMSECDAMKARGMTFFPMVIPGGQARQHLD